ncbi:hypothetical protein Tco_0977014 [Tanacetum coccineum]|uniref:F-box protein n=1 Tax=Tanacetum coccineum TaxID=301880 RepID=A0ABQ5EJC9_9ASTR
MLPRHVKHKGSETLGSISKYSVKSSRGESREEKKGGEGEGLVKKSRNEIKKLGRHNKTHLTNEVVEGIDYVVEFLYLSQVKQVKAYGFCNEPILWKSIVLQFSNDTFRGVFQNVSEPRLAMSSDNASSAVTYTSISSDSNGLSWALHSQRTAYEKFHVVSKDYDIQGRGPAFMMMIASSTGEEDGRFEDRRRIPRRNHTDYRCLMDEDGDELLPMMDDDDMIPPMR